MENYSIKDAFKALKDIDATKIKTATIKESIKSKLPLKEAKSFNLGDQDNIDKAKDFKDSDDEKAPIEKVVDPSATLEADLGKVHTGQLLLQCPTCKTVIYKKVEELVKSEDVPANEENKLYNVGEECPHCQSKEGFELVGQVAPVTSDELESGDLDINNIESGEENSDIQNAEEESGEIKEPTLTPVGESLENKKEESGDLDEKVELNELTNSEKIAKAFPDFNDIDSEDDVDEELDEKSLDEAISNYITKEYENVSGYKTTDANFNDSNLIIEGKIRFKSGSIEPTKFIFEAYNDADSIKFKGLNETFSKEPQAFTLNCYVKDKALITESFNYLYKASDNKQDKIVEGSCKVYGKDKKLNESVDWDYYNKFDALNKLYLPDEGEGDTMASQIVTAINKLVYKWYNDGDVYDNTHHLEGWGNDLSSYANWLYNHAEGTRTILNSIFDVYDDSDYEDLLKKLTDLVLNEEYLKKYDKSTIGSIYEEEGPFKWRNTSEEDEEE